VVSGKITEIWIGFAAIAVTVLVLAAIAGFVSARIIRPGAPVESLPSREEDVLTRLERLERRAREADG
jgi:hypothetical protein